MTYPCTKCGGMDITGWTFYWFYVARGWPPLCAVCEPCQRCHWHNAVARIAQDEADLGEVDL